MSDRINDTIHWYGRPPEITDDKIVEKPNTEILICGAGHTELVSALAAAEQGAKTLVIEKNATIGSLRMWISAVDTKAQLAAGVKINKTEIVNDLARYGSNHIDQKLMSLVGRKRRSPRLASRDLIRIQRTTRRRVRRRNKLPRRAR